MKKLFLILLFISFSNFANAELLKTKPIPLAEQKAIFPNISIKYLTNGMKVYLMKDNEQPLIQFSMLIKGGAIASEKAGLAGITMSMLTKGTNKMTAEKINDELDFISASIFCSALTEYNMIYAGCLTKNQDKLLKIFAEAIINPSFPKDELSKIIDVKRAELQERKTDGDYLAGQMSKIALYGKEHPYSKLTTEKDLDAIETKDLKQYHDILFNASNVTLAVSGDIDEKEILSKLEDMFGLWKKGNVFDFDVPIVKPMPAGVYFVNRPASVQSVVQYVAPIVGRANPDFENAEMLSNVMGSGFSGILFKILREKHSFTYSPYSYVTENKFINKIVLNAEVRNSVTDSTISVMVKEMNNIAQKGMLEEDFNVVKQYKIGNYSLGFEDVGNITRLVQTADFYNMPVEYVQNYTSRLLSSTNFEVQKAAQTYFSPLTSYIIVVGDLSVRKSLEKFGNIFDYDVEMKPTSLAEKVDISAKELLNKAIDAIGGRANIEAVTNISSNAKAELNSGGKQYPGTYIEIRTKDKKYKQVSDFGIFKTTVLYNGNKGWNISNSEKIEILDNDLEKTKQEATLFKDYLLLENGFQCEVLGKRDGLIMLKAINKNGSTFTYFYNETSFLISKIEQVEETSQGPIATLTYIEEYGTYGNIKLPKIYRSETPFFISNFDFDYILNSSIENSVFEPNE
ncbi:MAG: pitrilysin family protein [Candidatus Kapabacteria bacterium]|nr:pitrilysin family protein [Candidatus Kapabacteria bacterium]